MKTLARGSDLAFILVVPILIAIDVIIYQRTEPQDPQGYFGLSAWTLIVIVVLAALVVMALISWRRASMGDTFANGLSGFVIGVTVICVWASVHSIEGIPTPASIANAPPAVFTRSAQHALTDAPPQQTCHIVRRGIETVLPTPYQVCADNQGIQAQVDYWVNWNASFNDPTAYGLVYEPRGSPQNPDSCQRYLGHSWWAVMGSNDPAKGCPNGFTFIGAP